ncbi:hypothetical protein Patl1_21579 [Pistacia atlantica]|uniref:Uncharacterized protein n=1 Tax=Pistacia atlantica TaxID=434234 RepID=A0ACC1BLM9_9ROSI|nr:hypothetical protein Patl1_21579 [Pistacia atlantica]
MTKPHPQIDRTTTTTAAIGKKHQSRTISPFSCYSPQLSLLILVTCVTLFVLCQIQILHVPPISSPSPSPLRSFISHQWQTVTNCTQDNLNSMAERLRHSVTFVPLKDLRYTDKAVQGHTWFMSSMYDSHEEGEVQYQQFPSKSSDDRLLCLKGRDTHDGSWNYYALAWPETLPVNATLMKGLTFVSYNHYNYDNIWHGLSAVVPFVAWHRKNGCESPTRWILYHWGELRLRMGSWLTTLMEATFNGEPVIEGFDGGDEDGVYCFEKAVVMRHNEGGMSREKRMEVYDLMRCKARMYCNMSPERRDANNIGMTLFMRTGPRSFKNESIVTGIFRKECGKVDGCKLMVAYSNNLTFCEQVKLMSMTDILVSPHGAQLTNMFLMDRNSSVMEFFPKGWLKLAGVGQYVYHWIASWSGMRHQGAWRDPDGEKCSFPKYDRRCMSIYKSGRIGLQ